MKKILLIMLLVLMTLTACQEPTQDYLEKMQEARTPYIGNASAVRNLLGFQETLWEKTSVREIELFTTSEPYELIVYLEGESLSGQTMRRHAFELISFIDNADRISFQQGEDRFTFLREEMIASYGPPEEDLENLRIQLQGIGD